MVFKLNIIFGVMMFAVIPGTLLQGGEVSSANTFGVVLIIVFVVGVIGVIVTSAVYMITHALTTVKSIVKDIKR